MRKPRDYDSELKALGHKARQLKERKVQQFGELVTATGADALPIEQLAGTLLSAVDNKDPAEKEAWRKRGAAFFQGSRHTGGGARPNARGAQASDSGPAPATGQDRA
ncbi:conjugal transfer protein TraD [Sphingomonas sp.]|uniref:conjugal transfer protein TraD n=1 Tax=Sphingomonas sp. TaxID=28214 RepID=UPI003D6D699E